MNVSSLPPRSRRRRRSIRRPSSSSSSFSISLSLPTTISILLAALIILQGLWMGHDILSSKTDVCREDGDGFPFQYISTTAPLNQQDKAIPSYSYNNATTFTWRSRSYNQHQPLSPFYSPKYHHSKAATSLARTWHVWEHPFPCVLTDHFISRTPITEGMIYMKEFKTGSSTLTSIAMRLSRNQAKKKQLQQLNQTNYNASLVCQSRFLHSRARSFRDRNLNESYLWSVIREPAARAISKFYHFGVSREKRRPVPSVMMEYFRDTHQRAYDREYYLKSLTVRGKFNPLNPQRFPLHVAGVLEDYNFIGISERMDESLVVLQLLLGLQTSDILYVSSKASGTFEWWPAQKECVHIKKSYVTPGMRQWFHSQEWKDYIYADVLLYKAVNESLDLTIQALGRDRVQLHLARFQWAQRELYKRCANATLFPCTVDGERNADQDCIWDDSGCGLGCLDEFAEQLPFMEEFNSLPTEVNHEMWQHGATLLGAEAGSLPPQFANKK